jgi:hypothetical protein
MSGEVVQGWEVVLQLRGIDQSAKDGGPVTDLGTTRIFVGAPDLTRAEETALEHVKDHTPVAITLKVTEARVIRITRMDDCLVIWRAALH